MVSYIDQIPYSELIWTFCRVIFFEIMDTVNKEHKHCVIMGDMNIDLLKFETHLKTIDYLDNLFQMVFYQQLLNLRE